MNLGRNDNEDVFALIERAEGLIELKRWWEAISVLQKAVALQPDNYWALCSLSWSLLSVDEVKDALKFADLAVQGEPESEWGHRLRAHVLLQQGKNKEAHQAAQEAFRLAPEGRQVLFTLTHTQLANRQVDAAEQSARRLLEIAPDDSLSFAALALVAAKRKQWIEVENLCRRALAIEADSYEVMNLLGLALLQQGCDERAIKILHQAAKLNPAGELAQQSLKIAVDQYLVPAGGVGFIMALALVRFALGFRGIGFVLSLVASFLLVVIPMVLILLVFPEILHLRRDQYAGLPLEVQRFISAERRRTFRRDWLRLLAKLLLVVSATLVLWWLVLGWVDAKWGYWPRQSAGFELFLALCVCLIASWSVVWLKKARN